MDGYKKLYAKNIREIENMREQRVVGLEKLADASVQVEVLRKELSVKEKEIIIATASSTEVKDFWLFFKLNDIFYKCNN